MGRTWEFYLKHFEIVLDFHVIVSDFWKLILFYKDL